MNVEFLRKLRLLYTGRDGRDGRPTRADLVAQVVAASGDDALAMQRLFTSLPQGSSEVYVYLPYRPESVAHRSVLTEEALLSQYLVEVDGVSGEGESLREAVDSLLVRL